MFNKILIANRSGIAGAFLGAFAGFAGAAPAQPAAPRPVVVPMILTPLRIETLSLDRAFALFRAMCMDSFPDGDAVARAVLAAGLGFVREESAVAGERIWTSRYGEVIFHANRAMADGRPMEECDFRFAIPDALERDELVGRIGQALARGSRRFDADGTAIWDLGRNFADRLNYFPASSDLRYFSLNRRRIHGARPR